MAACPASLSIRPLKDCNNDLKKCIDAGAVKVWRSSSGFSVNGSALLRFYVLMIPANCESLLPSLPVRRQTSQRSQSLMLGCSLPRWALQRPGCKLFISLSTQSENPRKPRSTLKNAVLSQTSRAKSMQQLCGTWLCARPVEKCASPF